MVLHGVMLSNFVRDYHNSLFIPCEANWRTDGLMFFFCILPVPWGVLQRIQWCNTCGFAGNTHQGLVGFSWGSPQLIPSNNESIIELNGICIYMIIHVHTVLIRYYPSWVNYEASSNTIAQVCSNTSDVLDKFQLAYDRTLGVYVDRAKQRSCLPFVLSTPGNIARDTTIHLAEIQLQPALYKAPNNCLLQKHLAIISCDILPLLALVCLEAWHEDIWLIYEELWGYIKSA